MNNRGVDKTQSGVARVDRRQVVDLIVESVLPAKAAREYTVPSALDLKDNAVRIRVHPGDVQVVGFTLK
jgi:hypothetical protein